MNKVKYNLSVLKERQFHDFLINNLKYIKNALCNNVELKVYSTFEIIDSIIMFFMV